MTDEIDIRPDDHAFLIARSTPPGFSETDDVDTKISTAVNQLTDLLLSGHALAVASSFGKDSSSVLALALKAARNVCERLGPHACPPIRVLFSDTKLDNPVMVGFARSEIEKVRQYSRQHGLPVKVLIAEPSLSEDHLVNMIGGRSTAVMPENKNTCSVDIKVRPMRRLMDQTLKDELSDFAGRTVVLTGKRFSESAARRQGMDEHDEVPWEPAERNGQLMLHPIAHWQDDDVFMLIAYVRNNMFDSYSDFEDLVQIYRDAQEGACMINAVQGQASQSGCGSARGGCWSCNKVSDDKSMESFLKIPEHQYMAPLWHLRNYIKARHHDPEARNWLAKTMDGDGTITVGPNAYGPRLTRELLFMALSIQADEYQWADQHGVEPRFDILDLRQLMAIETLWLRYGLQQPFETLRILRRVQDGERLYPPIEQQPSHPNIRTAKEKLRFDLSDDQFGQLFSGLRDVELALIDQEPLVEKGGQLMTDWGGDTGLSIEAESVELFHAIFADEYLEKYGDAPPSAGFNALLRLCRVVNNRKGERRQLHDCAILGLPRK
jgi:3'-phosphoadenosine 5'-phosphosulfate sulfotransferase (PAPS reductase)/FAD synthetase